MKAGFRRDNDAISELVRFVEEFFQSERIDPSERFAVDFALEEIFTNFVKYNQSGEGDIEVGLNRNGDELVLELIDRDSGNFDLGRDAPEVDIGQSLEKRVPGGLGVHLVKSLMDRVEYSHNDRTSTVTLYKRLGEQHA